MLVSVRGPHEASRDSIFRPCLESESVGQPAAHRGEERRAWYPSASSHIPPQEMLKYSKHCEGAEDLQEALSSILGILKAVNDSMHLIAITGYDVRPHGGPEGLRTQWPLSYLGRLSHERLDREILSMLPRSLSLE